MLVTLNSLSAAPPEPKFQGKTSHEWLQALQNPLGREAAVKALGEGGPGGVLILREGLRHEKAEVREAANRAAMALIPILIASLKDPQFEPRWQAMNALGSLGQVTVPALMQALKDRDAPVREGAAAALRTIGSQAKSAVPALIELLRDSDANVRRTAAEALGSIDREARQALPALRLALQDADAAVRVAAALAVAQLGDVETALRVLVRTLLSQEDFVRDYALFVLGDMCIYLPEIQTLMPGLKEDVKSLVPILRKALKNEQAPLRLAAVRVLGVVGAEARPAIPDLAAALKEAGSSDRLVVAEALVRLGDTASVRPILAEALKANAPYLRVRAAELLVRLGETQLVVPVLIDEVTYRLPPPGASDDYLTRSQAITLLGQIGPGARTAVPVLQEALKDPQALVRTRAAEALKKIAPEAAAQGQKP
jgi:HEAT repeat protein